MATEKTLQILRSKMEATATTPFSVIVPLPFDACTLKRVEAFSLGTGEGSVIATAISEVYLQNVGQSDIALHLISQEPLTGWGVVAWDGELNLKGYWKITANFTGHTVGEILEVVAVVEV